MPSTLDRDDARKRKQHRGVYEHPKGSGVWCVCFFDEHSRRHRQKVGPKALAIKVYQKRKTEVQERRFFPERLRRRDVLLTDFFKTTWRASMGGFAVTGSTRGTRSALAVPFQAVRFGRFSPVTSSGT
jgi:hypothetical protein